MYMNDLISRQAAIEAVRKCPVKEVTPAYMLIDKAEAMTELMMAPSAQPMRKKGKWKPHREKSREYIGTVLACVTYDYWLCDICGYRVTNGQPMYNFCPHCGADMRGDADETD